MSKAVAYPSEVWTSWKKVLQLVAGPYMIGKFVRLGFHRHIIDTIKGIIGVVAYMFSRIESYHKDV